MLDNYHNVRGALFKISPGCGYGDWYRLAAAIYDALGNEGFSLFDEWSARSSEKYPGTEICRQQWDHSKRLTQITKATLFYLAREAEKCS